MLFLRASVPPWRKLLSGLRPRLMFCVHALQSVQRDVGIDLRRRNVGVAENRLHGAQVGAVFYHASGATVAQHVRAGVGSNARRSCPYPLPDALGGILQ